MATRTEPRRNSFPRYATITITVNDRAEILDVLGLYDSPKRRQNRVIAELEHMLSLFRHNILNMECQASPANHLAALDSLIDAAQEFRAALDPTILPSRLSLFARYNERRAFFSHIKTIIRVAEQEIKNIKAANPKGHKGWHNKTRSESREQAECALELFYHQKAEGINPADKEGFCEDFIEYCKGYFSKNLSYE